MNEHSKALKEEVGETANRSLVEQISTEISSSWSFGGQLPKSPVVLMIGGLQGSGKTTALEILRKETDLIIISPDQIRQKLFSRGIKFSEEFVHTVNATRNNLLKIALPKKHNIAIDQFVNPERLNVVEQIVREDKDYRVIRVLLLVEEETLIQRVEDRENLPGTYKGTMDELKASIEKHGQMKNTGNLMFLYMIEPWIRKNYHQRKRQKK